MVLAAGLGLAALHLVDRVGPDPSLSRARAPRLWARVSPPRPGLDPGPGGPGRLASGRVGAWGPSPSRRPNCARCSLRGPDWGWRFDPAESPVLRRLLAETDVGLVAGRLENLPARAGLPAASPTLGIPAPPPNYLLQAWYPRARPPGDCAGGDARCFARGVDRGGSGPGN